MFLKDYFSKIEKISKTTFFPILPLIAQKLKKILFFLQLKVINTMVITLSRTL